MPGKKVQSPNKGERQRTRGKASAHDAVKTHVTGRRGNRQTRR